VIYAHVTAGLLGAILAALTVWQVQDWRFSARIAQMQQDHTVDLKVAADIAAAQQVAALDKLQALNTAKQKVEEKYAIEKRKAAAAASSARAELDGLRKELRTPPPALPLLQSTPSTDGVNAGTVERKLLGACAAALVEMAAGADSLATQLVGLQGYVRDVCAAPK
jgi:hypothetical protein